MTALVRPLIRLPTIVFPQQPLSLTKVVSSKTAVSLTKVVSSKTAVDAQPPFSVSDSLLLETWEQYDGTVAAFGPASRVGVLLHIMYDQCLESRFPTPAGVAHAVGGRRVRLSRLIRHGDDDDGEEGKEEGEEEGRQLNAFTGRVHLAELIPLPDEELAGPRLERLADEADAARRLVSLGVQRGLFALESSALDEETGGLEVCDPRCHPLWPADRALPEHAGSEAELSFWLSARLPLTTELRAQLLATLCPLRRMQACVDALRLLCDPHRPRDSNFKYRLIYDHPASDDLCGTGGRPIEHSRAIVGFNPPAYTRWTDSNAFPHG